MKRALVFAMCLIYVGGLLMPEVLATASAAAAAPASDKKDDKTPLPPPPPELMSRLIALGLPAS